METHPIDRPAKARAFVETLVASRNAPWRAKSVLLALAILLAGGGLWVRDSLKEQPPASRQNTVAAPGETKPTQSWGFNRPLPVTVRAGASYIGGFLIGWTFRRFIRIAVVLTGAVVMLVGLGKYAGCDTAPTEAKVKESSALVQREAKVARDYLKGLLPSASAGAIGIFLGFRRKDHTALSRE